MFNFEINADKLRLNPVDPFGGGNQCVLYLEQFDGEKWNSLAYPDFYIGDTSEEIYKSIDTALVEINAYLGSKYGKDATVPDGGFDLVRYIIDNQTSLDGIKLKVTK